jgi:plasmid stabilization system protein ParE
MAEEAEVPPVMEGSVRYPGDPEPATAKVVTPPSTDPAPTPEKPAETPAPSPESKTTVPDPSKPDNPSPAAVVDPLVLLKEKTKGKINSFEELESLVNTPREEFANDRLKALNDWVKKGGKEEDYFRTQSINVEAMSPSDIVKTQLALEKPHLTSDEVDLLFEDQYGSDPDTMTERELKMRELRLKEKAREDREKILAFKEANAVPDAEKQRQAQERANKEWQDQIEAFNKDFSALEQDITFGEDGKQVAKLSFAVKNKDQISEIMKNPNLLFDQFVRPDGTPDLKKFREVVTIATNFAQYQAALAEAGSGKGIETVVHAIKNPSTGSTGLPPAALTEDEITANNMAEAMRKKGY